MINNKSRIRKITSIVIDILLIPSIIAIGVLLFNDRKYNIVSIIIAFLACVPFFIGFEKGKTGTRELVVIAVMTALSVVGRLIFAPLPGFKPVTAIVIITAIAFGGQAGFITGAIFISIDDNEQANLKLICDEIFGANNFLSNILWQSTPGSNTGTDIKTLTEYVLFYAKNKASCTINTDTLVDETKYKIEDEYVAKRGKYVLNKLDRRMTGNHYSEALNYPILMPNGMEIYPGGTVTKHSHWNWRWSQTKVQWGIENGFIVFKCDNEKPAIYFKQYMYVDNNDEKIIRSVPFVNLISNIDGVNSARGTRETMDIFNKKAFDYPKPINLIKHLMSIKTRKNDIILDSFAGSGTTAHAVLNLNKEDGGNRKFICVEMMDYAETITAERVKRVIKGYGEGSNAVDGTGGDFSYYELGEPLFNPDKTLNETVGVNEIRKYVYYMETKESIVENSDEQYLLGKHNETAYYFYYEKEQITTLNKEFLITIKTKADGYVIYADKSILSDKFMTDNGIVFKKIPRDITKL